MATVDKNFRIKNGLVVEGSTATVNGNNILTENIADQYILNLIGGETLVKSVDTATFNVDGSGKLTINANTFDSYGSAADAQNAAALDATNKANQALSDAQTYTNNAVFNLASESYVNTAVNNAIDGFNSDLLNYTPTVDLDTTIDGYGYLKSADLTGYATEIYADDAATNAANTAESNANTYTNNAIGGLGGSGTASVAGHLDILTGTGIQVNGGNNSVEIDRQTVDTWYDAAGSATAAENNAKAYTDQEVAALVSGAPALLDTLNELAAAIADNPNYATDVANLVATKADTTYVDGEISSLDTAAQGYASTAQSNAQSFATTAANNAQSAAEDYADSLASNYDAAGSAATAQSNAETFATNAANAAQSAAEATAAADATTKANAAQSAAETYTDNAVNSLTAGDTQFTEVSIGWMTDQVASYAYANTGSEVVAYAWNHNKGASAKFLVRMRNGIHSQVSEILLTRDNSNNIAITEYGIVTTNGTLGDITAGMNGNNIELKVTPTHNDGTEIIVSGTLMSYGD